VVGSAVALAGEVVLVAFRTGGGGAHTSLSGDLLIAVSVLVVALGYVAGARLGQTGYNSLATTFWGVAIGLLVIAPVVVGDLAADGIPHADPGPWAAVIFLATVTSIVGYVGWYWALAHGGIARIATIQFLQPPRLVPAACCRARTSPRRRSPRRLPSWLASPSPSAPADAQPSSRPAAPGRRPHAARRAGRPLGLLQRGPGRRRRARRQPLLRGGQPVRLATAFSRRHVPRRRPLGSRLARVGRRRLRRFVDGAPCVGAGTARTARSVNPSRDLLDKRPARPRRRRSAERSQAERAARGRVAREARFAGWRSLALARAVEARRSSSIASRRSPPPPPSWIPGSRPPAASSRRRPPARRGEAADDPRRVDGLRSAFTPSASRAVHRCRRRVARRGRR
jgi:hypothetical protein